MKIIVCIKQVPDVAEIRFDPDTKTLIREGVPNSVNPFDRRALAEAIRLRDLRGGEVIVLALVECLGAGADRAIHLVDPAFAGSDTLATARALSLALRNEDYDIIFCGKYSVDAETGQVGPELAELLDLPQVTGATKLDLSEDNKQLTVERETDDGFETIECDLPVLLTAAERLIRPIKVKEPQLEAGRAKPIVEVSAADLATDPSIFGTAGSPTWVQEIKSLARTRQVEVIEGANAEEKAARLIERLDARGALRANKEATPVGASFDRNLQPASDREVWAVAELLDGKLRRVSFELLGKGIELAGKLSARLAAFVAGTNIRAHVEDLAAHGADRVYLAEDERLATYTTAAYASLLVDAIKTYKPVVVLLPSTSNGRDLAPRVAARLNVGLTADCINLEVNPEGMLAQHKPAFGGNIVALIYSRTLPQIATVKPGMLRAVAPNKSRTPEVIPIAIPKFDDRRARVIKVRKEVPLEVAELDEAERIVCAGVGIAGPENLIVIEELAQALGAQVGATRRVVDQGWLPRHQQIGLTGRVVSPVLYVGIGVRGALNHTIGIQQAGTIVAINIDQNAEIFHTADFGIVGDWAEVVPVLTSKLKLYTTS
ncbi:MAG: electron transfer flavoprotein alpha/ beta subunit [Acidobacteria bacterium]|nr:MAG: electron transfer flavoprotein alpha/ beta subunit [Acidobacteriota bacterium]